MSRLRPSARTAFQMALVVSLGLLVGWTVSRYRNRVEVGDGKYAFDSPLENPVPAQAQLQHDQRLALLVGIGKLSQPSAYLGVLQRKYGQQGLKVLAVFSPDSPRAHQLLANTNGIPWVDDKDGRYELLLKAALAHGHDAILIYDQNYRVKFHALSSLDNDSLRMLVEKYLLGQITYSPANLLAASLIGKRIDGLQCKDDRHPPAKGVFVVFPPGCSSCELNSYAAPLRQARDAGWGSVAYAREAGTLVFANGLDAQAMAIAKNLGFGERAVCAVREDALLDPYQTRKGPASVPLILETGEDGRVSDVQDLSTVANRSRPQ